MQTRQPRCVNPGGNGPGAFYNDGMPQDQTTKTQWCGPLYVLLAEVDQS